MLHLILPDQSQQPVGGEPHHFTASEFGLPADAAFSISSSIEGALSLHNTGGRALIIEYMQNGEWQPIGYVEPGSTDMVGQGACFYIEGHQQTTTFQVSATPATLEGSPAGSDGQLAKRRRLDLAPLQGSAPSTEVAGPSERSQPEAAWGLPDSALFLLQVRGLPAWANEGLLGVRLSDLVCSDIQWALLSNMMIDVRWLLSACPALRSAGKLVVVHGEKDETEDGRRTERAVNIWKDLQDAGLLQPPSRTYIHKPHLGRWEQRGCHHSKFFILEYATGVRVIIHTANYIYPGMKHSLPPTANYADCNNKTQSVYWQDFPPKDPASPETSDFESYLTAYLSALRLPLPAARHALALLAAHDFSSARVALVGSTPGRFSGTELHDWGHKRLSHLLEQEEKRFPPALRNAPLVAQFSSLASFNESYLTQQLGASMAAGLGPLPEGAQGLQLVWPTAAEVANCLEGWFAGSSIPASAKNVDQAFLQEYYCRWGGEPAGRQRTGPHCKLYLRHQGQQIAWLCSTSSNLSKAAWGFLERGGEQINVSSWELGVLLLPSLERAYQLHRHRGFRCATSAQQQQQPAAGPRPGMGHASVRFVAWRQGMPHEAVLEGGVLSVPLPVPFALPPQRYQPGDEPWAWDKPFTGQLDCLGRTVAGKVGRQYGLEDDQSWQQILADLQYEEAWAGA